MPGLQPLVFLGEIVDRNGAMSFAFQDTVSYVRFGSSFGAAEGFDQMEMFFISPDEIGVEVITVEQAARQVAAAAERAVALSHPVLPFLGEGWR